MTAETLLSLTLTAAEVNLVLKHLARAPLEEVLDVFQKIKGQAEAGLRANALRVHPQQEDGVEDLGPRVN